MNEEDTEDEQSNDQTLGAKIKQAMSTLEGDLDGTEDTETQLAQTGSESDKNESGSSQKESSSSGISSETEGVNDSVVLDKQEEELKNEFAAKVAKSQELFKEVFDGFLSHTKFQFVFKDQEKNDVSLSRADVIRLYNHHIDAVKDGDKKTQDIIDLQKRNEEILAEKDKWAAERNRMLKAEKDIMKMFQSMQSENESLKKKVKENEKNLFTLEEEKKIFISNEQGFYQKSKEQKALNEKMEKEKEDQSKQILQKDIEIEDLKKSNEKKRKELKDLRIFKDQVFRLQDEMVTEAVRCETDKWLDIKESWLSDKKALDGELKEEQEKSEKLNSALSESRGQVKKLQEKSEDLSSQIQKANTDLYRANMQLLSVGKGGLAKSAKVSKEAPKPPVVNITQEDIIQIDSD